MKILSIFLALWLLAGCGSDNTSNPANTGDSIYTPPQPQGVSETDRPPSPPAVP